MDVDLMISAIVGIGFAGLSVFAGLVQSAAQGSNACREIFLIDLESHFARGLAYRADSTTNLLNRPISAMHFLAEGDFTEWLLARGAHKAGAGVSKYLPRHRFGDFLGEKLETLVLQAKALGIAVRIVHDTVESVRRSYDGYTLCTARGLIVSCDTCYICVGSDVVKDPYGLKESNKYHDSPYPVSELITDNEETIGIIGSRLMAHDVVVGLRGRYKKIYLLSRSGLLPRIVTRYQLEGSGPKESAALFDQTRQSGVGRVAGLFRMLRQAFGSADLDFSGFMRGTCNTDRSIAFLRSLNVEICAAWASLDEEQRRYFLRRYHRVWQQIRIPVSYRSANVMDALQRSQAVTTLGGLVSIAAKDRGFVVNCRERSPLRVDRVINASGLTTTARDNALLNMMLQTGLASEHPLGGLRVDPSDLTLLDVDNARLVGLKCIGAMTYGDFYAVGNVDVVRWQARVATCVDLCAKQDSDCEIDPLGRTSRHFKEHGSLVGLLQ